MIYIDCTATYFTGLNTGIQRVVRNIVARRAEVGIVPVVSVLGRFWRIRRFIDNPNTLAQHRQVTKIAVGWKGRLPMPLFTIARALWRPLFHTLWGAFMVIKYRALPVRMKKDDVLVLADAWLVYGVLEGARKAPCPKVAVIYDLIPITHPQYVEVGNQLAYLEGFRKILSIADRFICISQFVKNELRQHTDKPVDYFYLGADIPGSSHKSKARHRTFLMVGTIEPRKGYRKILDAFETLWADGFDGRLEIVGGIGWMCDDIMERIKNSPYLGTKLFAFHNANDQELSRRYDQAEAIILASEVEGFGLPLVEAMQKGKPVLAHDIPVFREIGGDYPVYFTYKNLTETVRTFNHKPAKRAWLTWDQSVRTLMDKVA